MTVLTKEIIELLQNKEMKALKKLVNETDVFSLITTFKQLEQKELAVLFRLLDKERALEVFEQLSTDMQEELLLSFREEKAVEIIQEMDPDDRVRLLDELPATVAKKLVKSLSADQRRITAELMGYPVDTAGRVMNPEYIDVKAGMTVDEVFRRIKRLGMKKETIYTLYVTDSARKLLGVVSLRELVMAEGHEKVEDLMSTDVIKTYTETDQEEVARILQDADLLAVPVVDREERLVGIVTIDDAMDIIEEETTEDIYDKAGLLTLRSLEGSRSVKLVSGKISQTFLVRMPFLFVALAGGLLAGAVIDQFEETLEAIAILAIFIPVIMDMGGNVGTQSSTIFTRGLVLGQINAERFMRHLFREVLVGFSMGATIGVLGGLAAFLWQGIFELGLVIFISLTLTITLATLFGFGIPFILWKLGMDQAAGSDPFITTLKDITGLTIYFLMANHLLGFML